MAPTTTPASLSNQHRAKVQRDLADTEEALRAWWGYTHLEGPADACLYQAIEALMRTVATLAQVVEDQQAPVSAPSCGCQGDLHTCKRFKGLYVTRREG